MQALLALARWLPHQSPTARIQKTKQLVAAYAAAWPPLGILIWIEFAHRQELSRIRIPAAWIYQQIAGYGQLGWDPTTKTGRRWRWASAVLAGRREEALALLATATNGKRAAAARRQGSLFASGKADAASQDPRSTTQSGGATPENQRPSEATASRLAEDRAWLVERLDHGMLDPEGEADARAWLAELDAALAGVSAPAAAGGPPSPSSAGS